LSKIKAGIINVTGYAGVELARLLYQHPEVELISVTGRSTAGQKLGTVFPHLTGIDLTIEAQLDNVDVAFSAMPHKESAKEVIPLYQNGIKIVPNIRHGTVFNTRLRNSLSRQFTVYPNYINPRLLLPGW
jgi:N-acetyl-gamma-glutamyl-phosphate reductase